MRHPHSVWVSRSLGMSVSVLGRTVLQKGCLVLVGFIAIVVFVVFIVVNRSHAPFACFSAGVALSLVGAKPEEEKNSWGSGHHEPKLDKVG